MVTQVMSGVLLAGAVGGGVAAVAVYSVWSGANGVAASGAGLPSAVTTDTLYRMCVPLLTGTVRRRAYDAGSEPGAGPCAGADRLYGTPLAFRVCAAWRAAAGPAAGTTAPLPASNDCGEAAGVAAEAVTLAGVASAR